MRHAQTSAWCCLTVLSLASVAMADSPVSPRVVQSVGEVKPQATPGSPRVTNSQPAAGDVSDVAGILISRRTTYLTEPLRADGMVDFAQAINNKYGAGVTPDNNAAALIWSVVTPGDLDPRLQARFYAALGIERPADESYLTLGKMFQRQTRRQGRESPLFDQQTQAGRPWKPEQFPELAEWVRANEDSLSRIRKGFRRPRYYVPILVREDDAGQSVPLVNGLLLPDVQFLRDFARLLQARATLKLSQGAVDDAIEDVLDCFRLGHLIRQNPTLIGQLVGIAANGVAANTLNAVLEHGNLSAAQCDRILRELDRLPRSLTIYQTIAEGERVLFVDAVVSMAQGADEQMLAELGLDPQSPALKLIQSILRSGTVDWNVALETGNRWYDRIEGAARIKSIRRQRRAFRELDRELDRLQEQDFSPAGIARILLQTRQEIGRRLGTTLVALLNPAVEMVVHAERRDQANSRMVRTALALRKFQLAHQSYPVRIGELVPHEIPQIPTDPFSGQAIKYRRTASGYVLYSVGVNGRDDRGRSTEDGLDFDDWRFQIPMPPDR